MKIARKAAVQMHTTLTMSDTTIGFSSKRSIRTVTKGTRRVMQIRERTRIRPPIPPRGRGRSSVVLGLSSKLDSQGVNATNRKPVAQISKVLCRQSEIAGLVVFHDTEEFQSVSLQISIFSKSLLQRAQVYYCKFGRVRVYRPVSVDVSDLYAESQPQHNISSQSVAQYGTAI